MRVSLFNEATRLTALQCGRRVTEYIEHFRSPTRGNTWESWGPGDSYQYLINLHADIVALEVVLEQRMAELGIEGYPK
jgi:hypothetical protein